MQKERHFQAIHNYKISICLAGELFLSLCRQGNLQVGALQANAVFAKALSLNSKATHNPHCQLISAVHRLETDVLDHVTCHHL